MSAAPHELLGRIVERAASGTALSIRDLLAFDPATVARLFDDALIERRETRQGIVIVPTPAAKFAPVPGGRPADAVADKKAPAGWPHEDIEYLRRAYCAGAPFIEMIADLKRTATDVLRTAWALKLERPRLKKPKRKTRARNAHGGAFEIVAPAWRVRRLRLALDEAFARGQNPGDDGEGMDHRALRRAFEAGRRAAKPRHGYRAWYTPAEDEAVRRLFEQGRTPMQIAAATGKELTGIYKKLKSLGLALPDVRWTTAEDEKLMAGLQMGMTARELVPFLPGRTRLAIKIRGYALWPGRGGKMWTDEESARLVEAYAKGENIKALAKELGRGTCSLRWRAAYLGLTHPKAVNPYTPAEDEIIRAGFREGRKVQAIADQLGRELKGVYCRAFKLGAKHRNSRPWTAADHDLLRRLVAAGVSGAVAARELDRELHATYKAASALGLAFHAKKGRGKTRPSAEIPDIRYGQRQRGRKGDGGWRSQKKQRGAATAAPPIPLSDCPRRGQDRRP